MAMVPNVVSCLMGTVLKILDLLHTDVFVPTFHIVRVTSTYIIFILDCLQFKHLLNIFLFKLIQHLLGKLLIMWYMVEICFLNVCVF